VVAGESRAAISGERDEVAAPATPRREAPPHLGVLLSVRERNIVIEIAYHSQGDLRAAAT
jgi:hypothetical protein